MADAIDPISAVANAVNTLAGGAIPFALDALEQKYTDEHNTRVREFQEILSMPDSDIRAARIADFLVRLANTSGQSIIVQDNNDVSIPYSVLAFLVSTTSNSIRQNAILNALIKK